MARSSQESSRADKRGSFLFAAEPVAPSLFGESSAVPDDSDAAEKKTKKTRKSSKKEAASKETPLKTDASSGLFDLGTSVPPDDDAKNAEKTKPEKTELLEPAKKTGQKEAGQVEEAFSGEPETTPTVSPNLKVDAPVDSQIPSQEETPEVLPPSETCAAEVEPNFAQTSDLKESQPDENVSAPSDAATRPVEVERAEVKQSEVTEAPSDDANAQISKQPSAYQVVARRYRPQTFEELIGQSTVARALSNAIETDRVGHAYLFTGARGVGKTSCARIFAKALNCVEGPTTKPCLKCDSCLGIATGDDVDVIEIDGASNRGVDEIRQLRQNATIAPSRSLYKIYIIDEVHMLTREAFNALLKTLEEPPARVKFIFCTTEPNKIPITILSRCQRFDFGGINGASIAERLATIAAQEGAQAEQGVFEILARRANGSMRDAQSLLEQLLSFAPTYITQDDVHNMLGSVDDEKIFQLLDATIKSDVARIFELLGELAGAGVDFGVLIEQTLGIFRDLMVVSSGCGAKELMYASVGRLPELQEIAQKLGARRILASLQILDQTSQRMRFSVQSRILVELAFARLSALDAFQPLEALIEQLRRGTLQVPLNVPTLSAPTSAESDDKKKSERPITRSSEINSTPQSPTSFPEPFPNSREFVEAPPGAPSVPSEKTPSESNASAPSLLDYSQEQLSAIWRDATKIGVMLPFQASAFSRVDVEEPDGFTVVFPASKGPQRRYCEDEKNKITARLSKILGFQVALRCLIDVKAVERPDAPPQRANAAPYSSRANYSNRANSDARASFGRQTPNLAEIENNETVRQIKETFDAAIFEIKRAAPVESASPEAVAK